MQLPELLLHSHLLFLTYSFLSSHVSTTIYQVIPSFLNKSCASLKPSLAAIFISAIADILYTFVKGVARDLVINA
jgi:hypothetical protein